MTNKEYIEAVLRTEAPVTPEMITRFQSPSANIPLKCAITSAIHFGQKMDRFKKHFFYGKEFDSRDTMAQTTPLRDTSGLILNPFLTPLNIRLLHAAMGLFTETTEILQALLGHIWEGHNLDMVNVKEELGDMFWYMGLGASVANVEFEFLEIQNIAKLRARYPEKFKELEALTRDLDAERRVLEGNE